VVNYFDRALFMERVRVDSLYFFALWYVHVSIQWVSEA